MFFLGGRALQSRRLRDNGSYGRWLFARGGKGALDTPKHSQPI